MPWRHALELIEQWEITPPENEMLAMLATVFTTWRPSVEPLSPEEQRARHQKSLDDRWNSGQAMNAKQLYEAMGGLAAVAIRMDGTVMSAAPIKDFPGTVH